MQPPPQDHTHSAGGEHKQPSRAISLLLLGAILVASCFLHVKAIERLAHGLESDEAVVGLMAKHISEGRELPVFYYGQPYLGSLEAFLVAGSFKLFGTLNLLVKPLPQQIRPLSSITQTRSELLAISEGFFKFAGISP